MIRKLQGDTAAFYREGENQPVAAIRETINRDTAVLLLTGSFGNDMAHELGDELEALASVDLSLQLDLSQVTYLAAYVQDQLLTAQLAVERHHRRMVLRHVPAHVYEKLVMTGFHEML